MNLHPQLIVVTASALVFGVTACSEKTNPSHEPPGLSSDSTLSFSNTTETAGIDFKHTHGGTGNHKFIEQMGPGCAFVDYDNDGHLDIVLVQGAPLENLDGVQTEPQGIFRNEGNGTFTRTANELQLDKSFYGLGVAAGDYDNDGWQDLFFTTLDGNRLFRNLKGKRFVDVTSTAGITGNDMSTGASWVDIDSDGFLDLFVCRYMNYSLETFARCHDHLNRPVYCDPNLYQTTTSQLWRNNGNGTFSDISESSGITAGTARAMGVATADLDGNVGIDLFVSSDMSPSLLFINTGTGTFIEKAKMSGVAFSEFGGARAGMGVTCGDYDNDLWQDLLITNYEEESNSLFHNEGSGLFREASVSSGVTQFSTPFLGWGCQFVDVDNDEWLDIFTVNGHVDDYADEKNRGKGYAQPAQLFLNDGTGKFSDASNIGGEFFLRQQVARGAAFGDYDNDGDMDVLINCNNQQAILLRACLKKQSI